MSTKKDLQSLSNSLKTNPAARVKFLSGFLTLLEKNGVNVSDEKVLKDMKLNLDLSDGEKFVKGLAASSAIVTIIY